MHYLSFILTYASTTYFSLTAAASAAATQHHDEIGWHMVHCKDQKLLFRYKAIQTFFIMFVLRIKYMIVSTHPFWRITKLNYDINSKNKNCKDMTKSWKTHNNKQWRVLNVILMMRINITKQKINLSIHFKFCKYHEDRKLKVMFYWS